MKHPLSLVLTILIPFLLGMSSSPSPTSVDSAGGPSPSATPSVLPSVPSVQKISPYERNRLRVEFKRAQSNELRALAHRHGFELKDLKASQGVRLREWEKKEKELRHQFFAQNKVSTERRAYVKDFLERRKVFQKVLANERSQLSNEQKVRQASSRQEQVQRAKEFEAVLEKGLRPPSQLWPQPGH